MSDKVRWGIVSTADIGMAKVTPAIQRAANGEVVAIASRDADRAAAAAAQLGIAASYGSYEELVADQETVTRRVIDYLGLDWDDSCLKHYENRRAVHNLSSRQVRRPVYASSVGRWKNYEKHLQPLTNVLAKLNGESP